MTGVAAGGTGRARRVAVVGAGISGLAAAARLRERLGEQVQITVYDQARRIGGKLRTERFAGGYVECGAESFLTFGPDGGDSAAVTLATRLGLADSIRHPAPVPAALAIGGDLRPIPTGTLLGVPADPAAVAAVARLEQGRDVAGDGPLLGPDEDVAVGALVRARFGDEVVDRLVDTLLGGVYAGRADILSLAATVPDLAAACRRERTLAGAVRAALAARAARRAGSDPARRAVFGTIDGGMGTLVDAVAAASAAELRLGLPVRRLARLGSRWRLTVGATRAPVEVDADAVVLAIPARPAARLLAGVDVDVAALAGVLDYASIALVNLALPAGADLPALSGFLVPAVAGHAVKGLTIFTTKWPHLARPDGTVLVRASLGRYGDTAVLRHTDPELVALVHGELGRLLGRPLPAPVATRVTRWGGGLPQYAPGHLERVAAARAALAAVPTLTLAGAGYDGVGVPACVRSGEAAADQIAGCLSGS